MAIEMTGTIYCPLSPQDPEQRLRSLLEQTQSRFILVHSLTRDILKSDVDTVYIDATVNTNYMIKNTDLNRLSNVEVTKENIAYVVFTSGSTGTPKAVSFSPFNILRI